MKSGAGLYILNYAGTEAEKEREVLSDAFKVKQLVPSPVLIDLFYYSSLKDKRLGENGLGEVLF